MLSKMPCGYRHASKRGRKRPETIYFLGFTLYCTRNQKGNFRIAMRTGEITPAACAHAAARPDAANAALVAARTGEPSQSDAPWSLCILRRCRKSSGTAAGPSCRGALLAQNAEQSELAWQDPLGAIPADQGTVPAASTKAALLLPRVAGYRHTVNQPLTSPVRETCTLGSVGAGDG